MDEDALPNPPAPMPGLLCRLGLHGAIDTGIWNDGHFFSACHRCGVPLIRTPEEKWHVVPRGSRVVWRPRTEDDVIWPSYLV